MSTINPSVEASDLTGVAYLFGYPISHSMSPLLHETVYNVLGMKRAQFMFSSTDISQFLPLLRDSKCYGACSTKIRDHF